MLFQDVGTILDLSEGPAQSIRVIQWANQRWLVINRVLPTSTYAGIKARTDRPRGLGIYTFTATIYAGRTLDAKEFHIQIEDRDQPLDEVFNNLVRVTFRDSSAYLNGDFGNEFGTFTRGRPFILNIKMDYSVALVAHVTVTLSGQGTSGEQEFWIAPPVFPPDFDFELGGVRVWMAHPFGGNFRVSNIVLRHRE